MLPKDDTQQNAELRQAFLRNLPKRVEGLQKRGQRLCKSIWDVNTVTLLFQDIQGLAGAAGRYGAVDVSEKLFAIESLLEPFVRQLKLPTAEEKRQLDQRMVELTVIAEPPKPVELTARDLVVPLPPALAEAHVPACLTPPEDHWRRFSSIEVPMYRHDGSTPVRRSNLELRPAVAAAAVEEATLTQASSIFGLDAAYATPAVAEAKPAAPLAPATPIRREAPRAKTGRIYYLSDIAPFSRELTTAIGALGYSVDRIESSEELKEMLGSLAPDMIVLDANFFEEVEHLGEFVKRVRQRVNSQIPLLAMSEQNDLNARLRAMRAGVDGFVPLPTPPQEAALRIRELLDANSADPFRVMIVEDDRSQAMFAESVLRKAGMDTQAVTDPLETLQKIEQFRPDLVLMDLYMPNISGMELTAIIRERDQFINTPIVFLSGEQDSEKHFEALSAGGDDFLAKPIRPKHLISAVTNRARRARTLARKRVLDPKDQTTGLFHRTYLIDRIHDALLNEDRSQMPGGLLFIEIEGAQNLREQQGLAVYEPVMKQVGANIASFARPDEVAARYGDASFALLSTSRVASELEALAHEIVDRLARELVEVDAHSVNVAARIGVCGFSPQISDAAQMINAAERACMRTRQKGNAAVEVFSARTLIAEGGLADAIYRALEDDGFQMLFQPIVSLHATGEEQYEVLLRLRTEQGEVISGGPLMEEARELGLVAAIDRWCLGRCFGIAEDRKRQSRPLRLYVNQGFESALDEDRLPWIRQILETRRIAPECIALEFKLTDVLARMREALAFFEQVRKLGLRVVVDDYDGGLTNLQLLAVLPADYIKLSTKYTQAQNNELAAELKTLVRAAHDAGKYVIASRVENANMAASLWTLGVDLIQGNFVQQPGADLAFDFSASAL